MAVLREAGAPIRRQQTQTSPPATSPAKQAEIDDLKAQLDAAVARIDELEAVVQP